MGVERRCVGRNVLEKLKIVLAVKAKLSYKKGELFMSFVKNC